MLRSLLYLLLFTLAVSVIKAVAGIIAKVFSESAGSPPGVGHSRPQPSAHAVGELRKDPVCGTFVSTATAIQQKAGGEVRYFCSTVCRDKFRA